MGIFILNLMKSFVFLMLIGLLVFTFLYVSKNISSSILNIQTQKQVVKLEHPNVFNN